jgi:hypothetical protein
MIFNGRIEAWENPGTHVFFRGPSAQRLAFAFCILPARHYSGPTKEPVMKKPNRFILSAAALLAVLLPVRTQAWDYEGHRVVNQLALASLPTNFPAFALTPAARERVAFLGGEPDRWRNVDDPSLVHCNGPDHYLDMEQLADYGLKPEELTTYRYVFTAQLALARAAHPDKFEPIDPAKNRDHTRELVGFAPWAIAEYEAKLKSGFSYLKAFQDYGGTPEEIANAQQDILYIMGVMGHFVGDCAQPLHATKHHHGWVGENPNHYTTNSSFHGWIDGGYFKKTGGIKAEPLVSRLRPAKIVGDPLKPGDLFHQVVAYLMETEKEVEPLYQLQKDGKLSGEGDKGLEGRAFLEGQLVKGGQMLGDLWYSAWQQATEDKYLIRSLNERKNGNPPKK